MMIFQIFAKIAGGSIGSYPITRVVNKSYCDLFDDVDTFHERYHDNVVYLFGNKLRYDSTVPILERGDVVEFQPSSLEQEMQNFMTHYREEIDIIKKASGGKAILTYAVAWY